MSCDIKSRINEHDYLSANSLSQKRQTKERKKTIIRTEKLTKEQTKINERKRDQENHKDGQKRERESIKTAYLNSRDPFSKNNNKQTKRMVTKTDGQKTFLNKA